MAATIKIPTVFTAVDKFSSVVKKMTGGVKKFAAAGDRANTRMNRGFKKVTSAVGTLGIAIGGAALLGVVKSSIQTFAKFEQANANLASVMGKTVEETKKLQADAKRLGAITAKSATEVVGLQEAYARLGFSQSEILNVTEATINGSVAMNAELAQTAELTGSVIRTFDSFSSIDAPQILDQMTLATQKSALNFEKLNSALPTVAGAANAAGIGFEQLLALLGKLSDAGIDASASGTALKNIFITSAKKGLSYKQILGEISKKQDTLTASNDKFGKVAAVSATILSNNLDGLEDLTATLKTAQKGQENSGIAQATANKQLNTLTGRVTILGSAYEGFILSLDDGTGAFSSQAKVIVEVVTEMLSLASGTGKATDKLSDSEKQIRKYAEIGITVIKTIGVLIGLFIAFKTILIASKVAMFAYNVAIGVMGATQGVASIAIGQSTVAMGAYKIVTAITAAVQWVLASAVWATLAPILAVVAAIVAIILIFKNWGAITDWFSEKFSQWTSFLIGSWFSIIEAFEKFSFAEFFMNIGKSILKFMLLPLKSVLKLINMLPGKDIGIVTDGLKFIEDIEASIDGVGGKKEVLESTAQKGAEITKNSVTQNNLAIDINDKGGNVGAVTQNGSADIPINLSNTQNSF